MFESFLITFRESLEVALIVGIVMAFLKKNHKQSYYSLVLFSVAAGVVFSLFFAYLFAILQGEFEGTAEQLFEGLTMMLAAGFLSYMILWLFQQKNAGNILKQKLEEQNKNMKKISLFFLVFFAVLREGVETVFFLYAVRFSNGSIALLAGFAGIFAALVLGYLLFVLGVKIPVKRFFKVSSFLLILFAAGLLAHGLGELQEAGLVSGIIEHVYDSNFILSEDSPLGHFAKGLFGYNGSPSLVQILAYLSYMIGAFYLFNRKPTVPQPVN